MSTQPTPEKKPRGVRTNIALLNNNVIPVYAGKRVSEALAVVSADMNIYEGVKLSQVLDAVYTQGKKDGARAVSDQFQKMMQAIPHRNPGQPKKKKK